MTELRPIRLDAELPYGLADDGRLVPVEDVPRGLASNCRCPKCGRRLIAKQGEILRWHFAHEAEGISCVGAFETMVHWLAKQIITDAGRIKIPPLMGYFEGTARRVVEPAREVVLSDVQIEAQVAGIRPDVLACQDNGMALAIEVWVAHRVDAEKIARIRERQLATMEIDLSAFRTGIVSADIFTKVVLDKGDRTWLSHPRQAEADAMAAAQVEAERAAIRAAVKRQEVLRREAEAKAKAAAEAQKVAAERRAAEWRQRMAEQTASREEEKRREAERIAEIQRLETEQKAEEERLAVERRRAEIEGMIADARPRSDARVAFLRGCPTVAVEQMPTCRCRTSFVWRSGLFEPWRCYACDPAPDGALIEVVRASTDPTHVTMH